MLPEGKSLKIHLFQQELHLQMVDFPASHVRHYGSLYVTSLGNWSNFLLVLKSMRFVNEIIMKSGSMIGSILLFGSRFQKPTLSRHIFENANTSIGDGIDYRTRHFLAARVCWI